MQADPELPKEIYPAVGDFRTYYIFFDVTKPPFDDIKVRQAFSHVIDRDAIKQQILGPAGNPGLLLAGPGFPASKREALAGDPEVRSRDGASSCWPRPASRTARASRSRCSGCGRRVRSTPTVGGAVASMITEHLGIEVEVSAKDQKLFMDSLNAKPTEILFGYVSYGMDYLDPSNMLGVWLSGGRHSWSNADFDAKVKEATTFLGDPAERIANVPGSRADPGRGRPRRLRLLRDAGPVHQAVDEGRRPGAGRERHRRHPLARLHDNEHGAGGALRRQRRAD